jgi:hypothetical protein
MLLSHAAASVAAAPLTLIYSCCMLTATARYCSALLLLLLR